MGWINAAHSHGVKILGTIITEWTTGEEICSQLLQDSDTIDKAVQKLAQVSQDFMFDGYLVNIENKVNDPKKLIQFIAKLNLELKASNSANILIYYDSVLVDGTLKWQNELNQNNSPFFDVCDGIFLNYNWNDDNLANSATFAKINSRTFDIFVGVDVFGRGCFGGGGLNMHKALEKISAHELSAAIFAPGWSFECHQEEVFEEMDIQLWDRCSSCFHYKTWKGQDEVNSSSSQVNFNSKSDPLPIISHKVLLNTDFSRGFGTHCYNLGKVIERVPSTWFDLSKTSFQPILCHKFIESPDSCTPIAYTNLDTKVDDDASKTVDVTEEKEKFPKPNQTLWEANNLTKFETSDGFNGGGCLRLSVTEKKVPHYAIYIPLDIPIQKERNQMEQTAFAILVIFKSISANGEKPKKIHKIETADLIRIEVEIEMNESKTPELICLNNDKNIEDMDLELELNLWDFIQNENISNPEDNVTFKFDKKKVVHQELNGWELISIKFSTNTSAKNINGIRVGVGSADSMNSDLLLGFLSLVQLFC